MAVDALAASSASTMPTTLVVMLMPSNFVVACLKLIGDGAVLVNTWLLTVMQY
jgi:hypothetical protein